jgi:hypothetical protein
MKKINSLLTGLLLTASVFMTQQASAQAPQKMSYQSVIRNSSNALLVNTQVRVRISVLQGTASGTAVYVETQTATTNGNGLLSIQIGTGPVTTGTFAGINWAAGPYFIKTETDPAGGSNYSITGTQEILSVPYAMYARTANFLPRMTYATRNAIVNPEDGFIIFCTDYGNPSVGGELQVYSGGMWRNMIGSPSGLYPTVAATTAATSITGTTATSGGNITSDGGSVISARGVCWSTIQNPTIADSKTTDGATTGSYISSITGLTAATTYYVRAYATNAAGTAYGTQISFTTFSQGIGGSYQGGKIAYFLQSGDPGFDANVPHGLIAAPSDQSSGAESGCFQVFFLDAFGIAIGTGNQNTIAIMNGCATAGIAARICGDLVLNSYNDWYLPSKDELNKLYLNKTAVGGFASIRYWSSTHGGGCGSCPVGTYGAWNQIFSNGTQFNDQKSSSFYVRAVRAF